MSKICCRIVHVVSVLLNECHDVPSTLNKFVSSLSIISCSVVVVLFFTSDILHTGIFFQETSDNPNPLAKAELNLLAHLVGGSNKKQESKLTFVIACENIY